MEARGWKTETNDKVGGKDANRWLPGYTLQKYPFQTYRLDNYILVYKSKAAESWQKNLFQKQGVLSLLGEPAWLRYELEKLGPTVNSLL